MHDGKRLRTICNGNLDRGFGDRKIQTGSDDDLTYGLIRSIGRRIAEVETKERDSSVSALEVLKLLVVSFLILRQRIKQTILAFH